MTANPLEVYALRFATDLNRKRSLNFFPDDVGERGEDIMRQDYFCWLIRENGRTILVDTGFNPENPRALSRRVLAPVTGLLAELNVAPQDVDDVVMSHLHWDHAGNMSAFPQARIWLQSAEFAHATGAANAYPAGRRYYDAADICDAVRALHRGQVHLLDGDAGLSGAISLHLIGGHTPGSQAVRCVTASGKPLVLAADAVPFSENFDRRAPFPILESFAGTLKGFDRILELAEGDPERIIPGHDPELRPGFRTLQNSGNIFVFDEASLGAATAETGIQAAESFA